MTFVILSNQTKMAIRDIVRSDTKWSSFTLTSMDAGWDMKLCDDTCSVTLSGVTLTGFDCSTINSKQTRSI